ncbi:hypothetical protein ACVW0Y_002829, partial [Pseudomonas sp. TE3786]
MALDSAGKIIQRAAQATSSSSSSSDTHRAGITGAASVGPMGAGMGASVGADGSYDRTKSSATTYSNGLISGAEVSIKAKGDHNMEGANISAGHLDYDIGGTQNITSKQNTSTMEHERGNWSASAGVAIATTGGVVPVASASASGGKDYDNSKLTGKQAGIDAGSMNFHVAGDQNLTGAHIVSTSGQGSYKVDGKTTASNLEDSRDKDGGYGGGGGGMSKSGIPSVVVEAGRVDQVKYNATQKSTVDIGNMTMNVAGGVSGDLNRDASKQVAVSKDEKIAGTDIRIEISAPSVAKKSKKGTDGAADIDGATPSRPRTPDADYSDSGSTRSRGYETQERTMDLGSESSGSTRSRGSETQERTMDLSSESSGSTRSRGSETQERTMDLSSESSGGTEREDISTRFGPGASDPIPTRSPGSNREEISTRFGPGNSDPIPTR